jgi:mannosyltransferase OCH1-like enzyme
MKKAKWPTFSSSMKYSYDYMNIRAEIDKWNILESIYEEYKCKKTCTQKIPKIVHQIWLGGNMPEAEQKMVSQVKSSLAKDWVHMLWTEKEINNLSNFHNKELYNQTPNYGQKSDILRYNILNDIGGVYMDTDFILLQQFDDLLDLDFFCGVAYDDQPSLFNGLIGSSPGNELIRDLLELDRPLMYHDAMKLMDSTGPFFLTRKVFKHLYNNKDICVLPNSFLYPLPNFDRSKSRGTDYKNYIEEESICCHMWSSSWM